MDKLNLIDFEKYTITEDGKIFSHSVSHRCKEMHGYLTKRGYIRVNMLCKDNQQRFYQWHRVIWFYFNGEIPEGLEVNHKDEDKTNNCLWNLEWCTRLYNAGYGTKGKRQSVFMTQTKGRAICQYTKDGEHIASFRTIMEASKSTGIHYTAIREVCVRGRQKTAGGYVWRYAEDNF